MFDFLNNWNPAEPFNILGPGDILGNIPPWSPPPTGGASAPGLPATPLDPSWPLPLSTESIFGQMQDNIRYGQMAPYEHYRLQHPQAGRRGGQVPVDPRVRHIRAVKARMAKPNRPQPPWGNQWRVLPGVGPTGPAWFRRRKWVQNGQM